MGKWYWSPDPKVGGRPQDGEGADGRLKTATEHVLPISHARILLAVFYINDFLGLLLVAWLLLVDPSAMPRFRLGFALLALLLWCGTMALGIMLTRATRRRHSIPSPK